MASADHKASVIVGAFLASFFQATNAQAAPVEPQDLASLDITRMAQCHTAEQPLSPDVPTATVLQSLSNVVRSLQNLYLHDLIYIEDFLHELPATPEAEATTRAVFDYYDEVAKHMDGGEYAGLMQEQLTHPILKSLSQRLLGYVGVLENVFGEDLAVHEQFTNIAGDLSMLKAYTTDHLMVVGGLPCPSGNPAATTGESLIGDANRQSEPVLAF